MKRRRLLCVCVVVALAAAGCGGKSEAAVADVELPEGFTAALYADGFEGPTQMVFAANGDLIVAELNGGENESDGRILRVDPNDPDERTVLQENLDKPTGVAVAGERLWIMERDQLSVTSLVPGADREVVVADLPSNGRSQGTLTITPDGTLLYNTSGSKRGAVRVAGSGMIFAITSPDADPGSPSVVAEGFKHAYARLVDPAGQLWSVEMTDGNFDGERASDELLAIIVGDDAGWPQCVDNNRAVLEFGGTEQLCAASPASHARFGPGATPTSFVISPWDPDMFIIALWVPGQVVTVPRTAPGSTPHEPTVLIEGIESPQHLLAFGDQLLVSDHETGRVVAISRAN